MTYCLKGVLEVVVDIVPWPIVPTCEVCHWCYWFIWLLIVPVWLSDSAMIRSLLDVAIYYSFSVWLQSSGWSVAVNWFLILRLPGDYFLVMYFRVWRCFVCELWYLCKFMCVSKHLHKYVKMYIHVVPFKRWSELMCNRRMADHSAAFRLW